MAQILSSPGSHRYVAAIIFIEGEVVGQKGVEDTECGLVVVLGTAGVISCSVVLSLAILLTQEHLRGGSPSYMEPVSLAVPRVSFRSAHRPLTLVPASTMFSLSDASSFSLHTCCSSRFAIFSELIPL